MDRADWLSRGGGGAHTREKSVAAAAERFVVMVSSKELVDTLVTPVPFELLVFRIDATLPVVGHSRPIEASPSPDGGVRGSYFEPLRNPREAALRLSTIPGVAEHGLYPPTMVNEVLIAQASHVRPHLINR